MSPAEISGTGVRLRAYRPDDAGALAAGYDDPLSHRFLPPLPSPFTVAARRAVPQRGRPLDLRRGRRGLRDRRPGTDDLLGGIGFDKGCRAGARPRSATGWPVGAAARRGHRGRPRAERTRAGSRPQPARAAHPLGQPGKSARRARRRLPARGGTPRRPARPRRRLRRPGGVRPAGRRPGRAGRAPAARPARRRADRRRGAAAPARAGRRRLQDRAVQCCPTCGRPVSARAAGRRRHPPAVPAGGGVVAGRRPRRPGHHGRRHRRAGRRHRALLQGAGHRPGDDRLQHAAGVSRARFRHPGGPVGRALGVRRDRHRPPHRGRPAVERGLAAGAGEGRLPP